MHIGINEIGINESTSQVVLHVRILPLFGSSGIFNVLGQETWHNITTGTVRTLRGLAVSDKQDFPLKSITISAVLLRVALYWWPLISVAASQWSVHDPVPRDEKLQPSPKHHTVLYRGQHRDDPASHSSLSPYSHRYTNFMPWTCVVLRLGPLANMCLYAWAAWVESCPCIEVKKNHGRLGYPESAHVLSVTYWNKHIQYCSWMNHW